MRKLEKGAPMSKRHRIPEGVPEREDGRLAVCSWFSPTNAIRSRSTTNTRATNAHRLPIPDIIRSMESDHSRFPMYHASLDGFRFRYPITILHNDSGWNRGAEDLNLALFGLICESGIFYDTVLMKQTARDTLFQWTRTSSSSCQNRRNLIQAFF